LTLSIQASRLTFTFLGFLQGLLFSVAQSGVDYDPRARSLLVTSLLVCWAANPSHAAIFVPPGLLPGDTYHLAFVTDGGRDALSLSIADYNLFVQTEAERPGAITETFGIDWFAIASTSFVHARDNAVVAAPVYLLDGTKIADGFTDIWDGDIDSPLDTDQFGAFVALPFPWTGTRVDGLASPSPLGPLPPVTPLDPQPVTQGSSFSSSSVWVDFTVNSARTVSSFYALSDIQTVPASNGGVVPELASVVVWLCLASVVGLVGTYRRWTALQDS
jgi:hypothetical protein